MQNPFRQLGDAHHDEPMHELDEAEAYRKLLDAGETVEAIAVSVDRGVSYIFQTMRLLSLIEPVQAAFRAGKLKRWHAVEIAYLDPDLQAVAFERCYNKRRLISVREIRDVVKELKKRKHGKPATAKSV